MRLIDADFFKMQVAAAALRQNIDPGKGLTLMELIDAQPTAYNLENEATEGSEKNDE